MPALLKQSDAVQRVQRDGYERVGRITPGLDKLSPAPPRTLWPVDRSVSSQQLGPTALPNVTITEETFRCKLSRFWAGFSLERCFSLFGCLVALLIVGTFGLDLTIGWPFKRESLLFDVTNVLCGLGLAYLSWDVLREQLRGRMR